MVITLITQRILKNKDINVVWVLGYEGD